ncbi:hypothetical protein N7492_002777 [Penicillium capsulatum]|uniref:Uncharacterized protein n=1 Tax=Penicillium capsulatum TaxID=69766 RepID=A0A9W9IKL9_9EURO|nr:hypothetical protein N7492_002777 [Penicillium capsulatum]
MEGGNMPISQAFTPPPALVPTPTGGVPQDMPDSALGGGMFGKTYQTLLGYHQVSFRGLAGRSANSLVEG